MKSKIFVVIVLVMVAVFNISAKNSTKEVENSSISYEKINQIYESLPYVGFESNRYTVRNYFGEEGITLPFSQKPISLFLDTPEEYKEDGEVNSKRFAELYNVYPLCFISKKENPYVKNVVNLYYNNTPFSREEIYRCSLGTGQFIMTAVDLDDNSFLIKHEVYDYHGEKAGVFMNGQIIFTQRLIDGEIPLLAYGLRVWEDKIIFKISQGTGEKKGFIILNPKTKELVFTDIKEFPLSE